MYSYNCFWALPQQSLWGRSYAELRPYFTVSFETLQSGGPGPCIYIPQEKGGQVIPLGTVFPLHHLLRLAGLQWRYSNPTPHGFVFYGVRLRVIYARDIPYSKVK
jgi:hypothetical protein